MNTKISISLLDNAIDELDCFAMEAYAAGEFIMEDMWIASYEESRSFKQAVKHLFNAGELLIKYRLQKEDWRFIFERIDEASEKTLKDGNFRSVRYIDAIKRLNNIEKKKVKFEEFSNLNKLRNRIEHFEFNIERIELLNIIILAANELLIFCSEQSCLSNIEVENIRFYQAIECAKETIEKLDKCRNELEEKKKDRI